MRRLLLVLGLAVIVGGCAGGPAGSDAAPGPARASDPAPVAEFDETTGAIQGVVLDDELRPVDGVAVSFQDRSDVNLSTDLEGRFALSHLGAGTYHLLAQKLGYWPSKAAVEVPAGEVTDVRLSLLRIAAQEVFHKTTEQRGIVGCGFGFRPTEGGTNGISICGLAAQTQSAGLDRFLIKWSLAGNFTRWAGAAMEMKWTTTQGLGNGLELRWEGNGCSLNSPATANGRLATMVGHSPFHVAYNQTQLTDRIQLNAKNGCNILKCKDPCVLQTRVFSAPGTLGDAYPADVGVTVQQPFTQYFSEFYVETIPLGFSALPDS